MSRLSCAVTHQSIVVISSSASLLVTLLCLFFCFLAFLLPSHPLNPFLMISKRARALAALALLFHSSSVTSVPQSTECLRAGLPHQQRCCSCGVPLLWLQEWHPQLTSQRPFLFSSILSNQACSSLVLLALSVGLVPVNNGLSNPVRLLTFQQPPKHIAHRTVRCDSPLIPRLI